MPTKHTKSMLGSYPCLPAYHQLIHFVMSWAHHLPSTASFATVASPLLKTWRPTRPIPTSPPMKLSERSLVVWPLKHKVIISSHMIKSWSKIANTHHLQAHCVNPQTNVLSWSCRAVPTSLTLCCQYDAVGVEGSVSTDLHGWLRDAAILLSWWNEWLVDWSFILSSCLQNLWKMDIKNHIIYIYI